MWNKIKGSVGAVIGELVVGTVMLFIGLFMLSSVQTATNLTNESVFYAIQTSLITTTSTIFSVLGLVIIVVALGTAIRSIQSAT